MKQILDLFTAIIAVNETIDKGKLFITLNGLTQEQIDALVDIYINNNY